eukprot:340888-Rhodomonas_salina.3
MKHTRSATLPSYAVAGTDRAVLTAYSVWYYAMFGTGISYGDIICGTDLAYGATGSTAEHQRFQG